MAKIFCSNINYVNWLNVVPLIDNTGIHIHKFNLQENLYFIRHFEYLLSDEENDRVKKFRQQNDSDLYKIGRIAIKLLLSVYNNCEPKEIEVISFKNKKPHIKLSSGQILVSNFNISHSKNILLLSISKDEIGVDVEQLNKGMYDDIMQKSFSYEEIDFVKNSINPLLSFYTIWTRKEALLKANGTGLIDELSEFSVTDGINTSAIEILKNKDYSVFTFPVEDLYVGSICYESLANKEIKFVNTNLSQFL